MKNIIISCLAILTTYYLIPNTVFSASEFTTTFDSLYTISQTGVAQVTHTITLQNKLAHYYATQYTLAVSGENLTNLQVSDETGPLIPSLTTHNGITSIHLPINRPSIGKDQIKTLSIGYESSDIVESIGNTMTINIPRLSQGNEADNYTRTVKVETLGSPPTLIYPSPNQTEISDHYTTYTFVGSPSSALTLLFGESVTYQLNLKYQLKNKEFGTIDSELALPPDTSYQRVLLHQITPPPSNVRVDPDGNWLARYSLKPQEKLFVEAELYVTVYPKPILPDPSSSLPFSTNHPDYWDLQSEVVQSLAQQLKTPFNIYTYLTNNFSYNFEKSSQGTTRLGATQALTSPNLVVCTEFTDTFVALARALNFPAREINGYAYTTNTLVRPLTLATDVLHAWPEYYDSATKSWIQIDPTWDNTTGGVDYFHKLDFSHLTFVRHGLEPTYPLPAGVYKDSSDQKYVQVKVASTIPPTLIRTQLKDGRVLNTGNVSLFDERVGYLPPYASQALPSPSHSSFYDKIKSLCASLLSKFSQLLPVSM
ncbi:MAG: transglutaminase domain-containing protein [bacterium]